MASDAAKPDGTQRDAFISAFEHLLGPMLRLGLHYGVTASEMSAALFRSALQTYQTHLEFTEQRPPSSARLAAYMGLSSKAFQAVADEAEARRLADKRLSADVLSAILGLWHTDPSFASVYELARDLEVTPTAKANAFPDLVRRIAPNADPAVALQALVDAACVERIEGGYVRATARAYFMPSRDHESRLLRMGQTLRQHLEVFYRNLTTENRGKDGLLERTLVADYPISQSGVQRFHQASIAAAQKLMLDLDATLTSISRDSQSPTGTICGIGVYFFDESRAPLGLAVGSTERNPST